MFTRVQKWGNSQGLRLSKQVLSDLDISVGDEVKVTVEGGALVVTPTRRVRGRFDLAELVRRIPTGTPSKGTPSKELDWGPPRGREVW